LAEKADKNKGPPLGHYQPRFDLVTTQSHKADLLIRDPSTQHKHVADQRKRELEDKRKREHFCGKLVKAYNDQRINQNKVDIREEIRNRQIGTIPKALEASPSATATAPLVEVKKDE
jgi:hypothetical protein